MTSTTATNVPPPLEAKPSPHYHSYDDGKFKIYECGICFDIMDTAVGCDGSCQTRFCRLCLEHVAKQGGRNAKCSHCRTPFTLQSIQVDEALQKEMENCMETIICPFLGCGKNIPIKVIKQHEAQCGHMKMKCKFSEWGCEWVGKKKDLEHHDSNECEFRNELGRLVNVIREKTLNEAAAIERMRDSRVNVAVNNNTRRMNMVRGRNAGNIIDVLAMSYEAICFPGRFEASKEMWGDMIGHAMTFNVLLVFPLILCIGKLPFWIAIDISNNMTIRYLMKIGLSGLLREFDTNIIGTVITLMALICFADPAGPNNNPRRWNRWEMPWTNTGYPLMRDYAAWFIWISYVYFVNYMEFWPGAALLLCTFSFTVSFSSCVAAILEKVNGSQADTLKKCKMWSPIVFAYRYSCLFWVLNLPLSLRGVVVLRLVRYASSKHFNNFNLTLEETECFFSAIPSSIYVAIGMAMTATDISNSVVKDWTTAFNVWFTPACVLAFVNAYTYGLYFAGQGIGLSIYREGEMSRNHCNERLQSNNVLPSQTPVLTGVAVFFLAVFYVVFIISV